MSDEIEPAYEERLPRRSRRTRILVVGIVGVVLAFFLITTFASFYTDHLWYASVGFTGVFDTLLWTRLGLFAVFGVLVGGAVAGNMLIAYRARPFFRPDSPEQSGLDRYRDAVTPIRTLLWVSVSLVVALFAGVASSGHWRTYLLWRNRGSFGTKDPFFHRDVGFYVFTLPWLHFLVGIVIAALILAALAATVVHYLYGGIRLQVVQDRMSRTAQVQLSVLIGLLLLVKGFGYWLDRFDLMTGGGHVSTGMSYTDDHAILPARNILVGVAVICAVLFFVNAWRRTWLLPGVGVSLLLATSILLGLIWPAIVQHFQVNPSEPAKETVPYLADNITATRAAYNLNGIKATKLGNDDVNAATVQDLIDQTNSVPLVDPALAPKAFEQIQQAQSYYSVAPVLDVDHYEIDGINRSLVLGVRELNQSGIPTKDQGWSNLHTVYTHGNGIIAAFGNQRPASDESQGDQMQWAQGQDPNQDSLEKSTGPFQNQIYFGQDSPNYSIVGKPSGAKDVELDLTSTSKSPTYTTYAGGGGVGVGGFFHQLMYSVKFGDPNFLLSERVNSDSRVLYYRDPAQRVAKVAPWLTLDSDVYPTVEDGHVLWVVDGYTTTDRYPQSESESFSTMTDDSLSQSTGVRSVPTDNINYIRNSVKATVDAYTGQVKLYAWDDTDPILRAWMSAFPGTVLPMSDIPTDLKAHLRYPEDYFKVQRYQYARYHVTDANDLYQANNTWDVAPDPQIQSQFQPPVRLYARDPDTGQQVWSLTSNYVPHNKSNLVGLLSVDSDATSSSYGQMKVELSPDQNTQGPGQVVNALISNPHITKKTQSFRLGDATPSYGNLLSVPLDSGLMYVEPVYATRATESSSSYLTLRYVMVAYGDKVGIGETLVDALADMVGGKAPTDGGTNTNPSPTNNNGGGNKRAKSLLESADRHFKAADKALKAGQGAKWVRLSHLARQEVADALNLLK